MKMKMPVPVLSYGVCRWGTFLVHPTAERQRNSTVCRSRTSQCWNQQSLIPLTLKFASPTVHLISLSSFQFCVFTCRCEFLCLTAGVWYSGRGTSDWKLSQCWHTSLTYKCH